MNTGSGVRFSRPARLSFSLLEDVCVGLTCEGSAGFRIALIHE
jgi:hypothetical protein